MGHFGLRAASSEHCSFVLEAFRPEYPLWVAAISSARAALRVCMELNSAPVGGGFIGSFWVESLEIESKSQGSGFRAASRFREAGRVLSLVKWVGLKVFECGRSHL